MKCGSLLSDTKFQFPNGTINNKFILVLCAYGMDWLVAQATRQPTSKGRTAGCQSTDTPPNYFIPAGGWFDDDTWIRLDEVFEYDSAIYSYKKEDGVVYGKGDFHPELMRDILQCALKSDDIDLYYLEFLEREYDILESRLL
jgi:hypothetical protein